MIRSRAYLPKSAKPNLLLHALADGIEIRDEARPLPRQLADGRKEDLIGHHARGR